MKNLKRNTVIVVVLLFVCVAVYLNWSYNNTWGEADSELVSAEDQAMAESQQAYENALSIGNEQAEQTGGNREISDYFAAARLTRQQSRDEALDLLQTAASTENVSQEIIDSAMSEISVMATWSMQEAQAENLLLAKDFADCVVFMSGEEVTVAVPAPAEGLSEAAVARITDVITTETGMTASQIRIIEVKAGAASDSLTDVTADSGDAADTNTMAPEETTQTGTEQAQTLE